MLKLRKFLCACFGFVALVYGVAAFGTVRHLIHLFRYRPAPSQLGSFSPPSLLAAVGLRTLANLILLAPLIIAVLCAVAWFTLRSGRSSGRRWAIAASTAMLTVNAILLISLVVIWAYVRNHAAAGFRAFLLSMIAMILLPQAALGIAGLAAFWRNDAEAQKQVARRKPPRISGDGTNPLLDLLSLAVGIAGFLAGLHYWERWGWAHHLRGYRYGFPLSLILIGLLMSSTAHETGHAVAGMSLGMKLRGFIVGPFQWRIRDGRWRFRLTLKGLFTGGGATMLVPTDSNQPQRREIAVIAAGPITELLFGLAALGLLLTAQGRAYEVLWGFLSVVVTICMIGFVGNLIPLNPEGLYSDGAKIYQLLKGGAWANFHRVMTLAASSTVTPLRPRDYDIDAIKRAEQLFTQGIHGILLRLLSSSYYLDCGKLDEARQSVTEATAIGREPGVEVPAELCVALVYRVALLLQHAQGARYWWGQMEASKAVHTGSDYWLARSALLLSEQHLDEARDAWNKADELVQKLPAAGDYEFDRYRCLLLRQALDSPVSASSQMESDCLPVSAASASTYGRS